MNHRSLDDAFSKKLNTKMGYPDEETFFMLASGVAKIAASFYQIKPLCFDLAMNIITFRW
jgi:hypothetical protein